MKIIIKLKNYIFEGTDKIIKNYIENNENLLGCLYIILWLYLLGNIYLLKNDKILLIIVFIFLLYIIKYIKNIIEKFDSTKKLMIFNMLFLILNILNIFFNIFRNILQDYIIYIRKYISLILNIEFGKPISYLIDNILSIISIQACYVLVLMYSLFHIYEYFFDFEKEEMKEEDYKDTGIVKHEFIFIVCAFMGNIGFLFIILFYKILHGIVVPFGISIIVVFCFGIYLIFLLNNFYVGLKYYKRNRSNNKSK